jgi:hypothetical protein
LESRIRSKPFLTVRLLPRKDASFSNFLASKLTEKLIHFYWRRKMFYRRFILSVAMVALALTLTAATFAAGAIKEIPKDNGTDKGTDKGNRTGSDTRVLEPLDLAVLVQDDLISQVGNELERTREFIRSLPNGSHVMVGYITSGTLQVRQPFTSDLDKAARSLRILSSSTNGSPYNPYVEVLEALRHFNANDKGKNVVLLISDGLDTSRGFDSSSSAHTPDLERAINKANQGGVAVYTFYAPSVGLTSQSPIAASYGQNSLNRLADDTGGKAFFQGTTGFVSFDSYFKSLARTLNQQYARAY